MREFFASVGGLIRNPNPSRTLTILVLLIIGAAIPLTVYINQQQQDVRQRASSEQFACGRPNQTAIGASVGTCDDGQGNTCTSYSRYVNTTDQNYDGVADPNDQGDQPWCDSGTCDQPCQPTPTPAQCNSGGQTFNPGDRRYDCANPRQRGNCTTNAGLGYPFICNNNGTFSTGNNGNPECTTECAPSTTISCTFNGQTFPSGDKRYQCANPRQRGNCADNAGLGYPQICNNDGSVTPGNNGNPECTTECIASTTTPVSTPVPTTTGPATCTTPRPKNQGNANDDCLINSADYDIWRDEFLNVAGTRRADFDENGTVDLIDFNIWRNNAYN